MNAKLGKNVNICLDEKRNHSKLYILKADITHKHHKSNKNHIY